MRKIKSEQTIKAEHLILQTIATKTKILFPIILSIEVGILFRLFIHSDSIQYRIHYGSNAILFFILETVIYLWLKKSTNNGNEPDYRIIKVTQYVFAISILSWGIILTYHDLKTSNYYSILSFICIISSIPVFCYINQYVWIYIQLVAFAIEYALAYLFGYSNHIFLVEYTGYVILNIVFSYYLNDVRFNNYLNRVILDDIAKEQEKNAYTDVLTEIGNRRALLKYVDELDITNDNIYSVVVLDLNGLKQINDNMGHEFGDEIIKITANALTRTFDTLGNCFRIGGDEFVAVLKCPSKEIVTYLYRLNRDIDPYRQKYEMDLTVSFGFADTTESTDFEELLKLADMRMYENKNNYYKTQRIDRRKHRSDFN